MLNKLKEKYFALGPRIRYGTHPRPVQPSEMAEHTCLNCGTTFQGNYCPGCGQRGDTRRLSMSSAIENLLGVLTSAERGIVHTCTDLLYRPGFMMRDYVKGHRAEYVKPIQLLFLLATIYLAIHYLLYHEGEGPTHFITDAEGNPLVLPGILGFGIKVVEAMMSNRAILALLSSSIFILPMWLAFRSTPIGKETTLTEFFYVMVYISCQQMIFNILNLPFDYLTGARESTGIGMSLLLLIWSFHQYFDVPWRKCTLYSFGGCVLLAIPVMIAILFANLYNHFGWTFLW